LYYFNEVYSDERLTTYESMNASDLSSLITELGLPEQPNQGQRKLAIKEHLDTNTTLPKTNKWILIRQNKISGFLPIFQRFSSSDYGNPENTIRKTLDLVYRSSFYETDEDGVETLKPDFTQLKDTITEDLDNKLELQLLTQLQKYKPEITAIKGNYTIEFSRGLSFSGISISDQSGKQKSLSQIGEGSKKKIFLSILEWDAEINLQNNSNKLTIRGYDEPDSNLHYEAQRRMFYVIKELASDPNTNVQSMICTHSLTMIDRAPSKCINHVIRDPLSEISTINYLDSETDEKVKEFLNQVSEVSGFKNSSIFYEKCFLIVEGESEQNAIPIMYYKVTGRHLSEDGIVLINLQTNGQWNNALRFLKSNKGHCTVMLLDNDTQDPGSKNQVTKQKLTDIGFDASFLSDHCFFIGTKEFEDVFSDPQLISVFNSKFPKHDSTAWDGQDLAEMRSDSKFSRTIKVKLSQECRKSIGKPMIAAEIAKALTKQEIESIAEINNLFQKISSII